MTEQQPSEFQHEIDAAVRHWTRLLTGRLAAGIDPHDLARRGVEAMLNERWRPPLKPPLDWRKQPSGPPGDPASNEAVREYREQLARRTQGETR